MSSVSERYLMHIHWNLVGAGHKRVKISTLRYAGAGNCMFNALSIFLSDGEAMSEGFA